MQFVRTLPLVLCLCLFTPFQGLGQSPETADTKQPRPACLVKPVVAEADPDAYLAALQIETRKVGADWKWFQVASPSDCPDEAPVVSVDDAYMATLTQRDRTRMAFDLEQTEPEARPRALSRWVLTTLRCNAAGELTPLIDPEAAIVPRGVVVAPERPPKKRLMQVKERALDIRVGGIYLYQFGPANHLGGITAEVGYSLFHGRLAFALAGGYAWGQGTAEPSTRVSMQGPELIAMLRGGLRFHRFLLRAGLGVGWHRCIASAETMDPIRRVVREISANSDAGSVAADLELLWNLAEQWNLGLRLHGRYYFGGSDYLDLDPLRYTTPTGAVGAQLALGVRL